MNAVPSFDVFNAIHMFLMNRKIKGSHMLKFVTDLAKKDASHTTRFMTFLEIVGRLNHVASEIFKANKVSVDTDALEASQTSILTELNNFMRSIGYLSQEERSQHKAASTFTGGLSGFRVNHKLPKFHVPSGPRASVTIAPPMQPTRPAQPTQPTQSTRPTLPTRPPSSDTESESESESEEEAEEKQPQPKQLPMPSNNFLIPDKELPANWASMNMVERMITWRAWEGKKKTPS